MQETWVRSLGWEDPLEEGMTTHSSIPARRIPVDRGTWRATVHRVAESRTQLSDQAQHSTHGQIVYEMIQRKEEQQNAILLIDSKCPLIIN